MLGEIFSKLYLAPVETYNSEPIINNFYYHYHNQLILSLRIALATGKNSEQCINFLKSFILFSFKDAEIDVSSYIEKIERKFTGALEYFPINLSSYIGTN